ncbi:MAG: hypothetical protein A3I85_00595 [Candidatus Nealsonbacteria bacterium RIFCSPLOWO2_02_FULL_38_63]|nr:MAG: hypothetical protein A3I85_00595 [Candidatus Nealsonbacteria bacterium RIFCSPLOWO2_02_FULL_38_63]
MDMLTSYSEFAAEIWRKDQKSVFLFGILQFKVYIINLQLSCPHWLRPRHCRRTIFIKFSTINWSVRKTRDRGFF